MDCIKVTRNHLQEKLVALYLRLNGYTTTGLLLHSPNERAVEGEVDIIGVRFSDHKQPDRIIECAKELEITNNKKVDIIIGEVKGGEYPLQFNESLRKHPSRVKKLIQWIGVASDDRIEELSMMLMEAVQHQEIQKCLPFPIVHYDDVSIRPIIFAPDRKKQRPNQIKFINGKEMISFCWNCFRPENRRETCETDYRAINNWGEQFEDLVGYFKNYKKESAGEIEELYKHFDV